MRDFLTLKMLPLDLLLMSSFSPTGQKSPILHDNLLIRTISHVKWVVFDQWGQKMAFFRFDQRESLVAFLGLKNLSTPYDAFLLRHPCILAGIVDEQV